MYKIFNAVKIHILPSGLYVVWSARWSLMFDRNQLHPISR